ncbi:hypothetical protein PIB30_107154 [Stylosanthes scabra]|uniref:Uncharacterized protein n=1 Tax=Stylosanthes scabra TaxID=79078 RepID=A0ABU6Z0F8_9FABA|nr:hypothetical protein [Stylosanthes scabra]
MYLIKHRKTFYVAIFLGVVLPFILLARKFVRARKATQGTGHPLFHAYQIFLRNIFRQDIPPASSSEEQQQQPRAWQSFLPTWFPGPNQEERSTAADSEVPPATQVRSPSPRVWQSYLPRWFRGPNQEERSTASADSEFPSATPVRSPSPRGQNQEQRSIAADSEFQSATVVRTPTPRRLSTSSLYQTTWAWGQHQEQRRFLLCLPPFLIRFLHSPEAASQRSPGTTPLTIVLPTTRQQDQPDEPPGARRILSPRTPRIEEFLDDPLQTPPPSPTGLPRENVHRQTTVHVQIITITLHTTITNITIHAPPNSD